MDFEQAPFTQEEEEMFHAVFHLLVQHPTDIAMVRCELDGEPVVTVTYAPRDEEHMYPLFVLHTDPIAERVAPYKHDVKADTAEVVDGLEQLLREAAERQQ